jgi:hypothetical protein
MLIDPPVLAYIQNVIKTADLVKIDNIIIEPGRVRAMDIDRTVVMLHNKNVPDMPFGSIGINRISVFNARVDIAKAATNFTIDAVVENIPDKAPFVRSLQMKGKGIKVDYRCANPATIQAPRAVDDPSVCRIQIVPEAIQMIQKGQSAMSTDVVSFICTADGVMLEMSDINNDKLSYHFADSVENLSEPSSGAMPAFSHRYPIKTLMALFKANSDGFFQVTTKGMVKIVVNNLDLYVLARE